MRLLCRYGLVSHALCAALSSVVREYLVFVGQLEHQQRQGGFTLQKLWYYVQPWDRKFQRLDKLCSEIQRLGAEATGGALLNILCNLIKTEG